jgi:hypothetical protein
MRLAGPATGCWCLFPRRAIPETEGPISAGRGKKLAVRAETDALDGAGMPAESEGFLAGHRVPNFHGTVHAGRSQAQAARTKADRIENGVSPQGQKLLAGARVPDL